MAYKQFFWKLFLHHFHIEQHFHKNDGQREDATPGSDWLFLIGRGAFLQMAIEAQLSSIFLQIELNISLNYIMTVWTNALKKACFGKNKL